MDLHTHSRNLKKKLLWTRAGILPRRTSHEFSFPHFSNCLHFSLRLRLLLIVYNVFKTFHAARELHTYIRRRNTTRKNCFCTSAPAALIFFLPVCQVCVLICGFALIYLSFTHPHELLHSFNCFSALCVHDFGVICALCVFFNCCCVYLSVMKCDYDLIRIILSHEMTKGAWALCSIILFCVCVCVCV